MWIKKEIGCPQLIDEHSHPKSSSVPGGLLGVDGGAWWAAVRGVSKSQPWLNDFTFTFHFHVLEKEMATHSSVVAWRIPGTGEPGGLPSLGLHRVGHDWSDLAAAAAATQNASSVQGGLLGVWGGQGARWQPWFRAADPYGVESNPSALVPWEAAGKTSMFPVSTRCNKPTES